MPVLQQQQQQQLARLLRQHRVTPTPNFLRGWCNNYPCTSAPIPSVLCAAAAAASCGRDQAWSRLPQPATTISTTPTPGCVYCLHWRLLSFMSGRGLIMMRIMVIFRLAIVRCACHCGLSPLCGCTQRRRLKMRSGGTAGLFPARLQPALHFKKCRLHAGQAALQKNLQANLGNYPANTYLLPNILAYYVTYMSHARNPFGCNP